MSEQNLRQEFEKSDSYNEFCHNLEWNNGVGRYRDVKTQHEFQLWCDGWQACSEKKDAELAALRGFAKYIIKTVNESKTLDIVDIKDAARDTNLIDESGNPTPLLTGENK